MKDLHVDNLDEVAKWLVEQGEAERAQMIYGAATYFEERLRDAEWDTKERRRLDEKLRSIRHEVENLV